MNSSGRSHVYEPVDDEAAEIIAGLGARRAGTTVCGKIRTCYGSCMLILGPCLDDVIGSNKVPVTLTLLCDEGCSQRDIQDNQSTSSTGRDPGLMISLSLMRAAGTAEARARRIYVNCIKGCDQSQARQL
jgi:hypothetical protein